MQFRSRCYLRTAQNILSSDWLCPLSYFRPVSSIVYNFLHFFFFFRVGRWSDDIWKSVPVGGNCRGRRRECSLHEIQRLCSQHWWVEIYNALEASIGLLISLRLGEVEFIFIHFLKTDLFSTWLATVEAMGSGNRMGSSGQNNKWCLLHFEGTDEGIDVRVQPFIWQNFLVFPFVLPMISFR